MAPVVTTTSVHLPSRVGFQTPGVVSVAADDALQSSVSSWMLRLSSSGGGSLPKPSSS